MAKKTLGFSVSETVYNQAKELFPNESFNESVFLRLMDAYKATPTVPSEQVDLSNYVPKETYLSLLEENNRKDATIELLNEYMDTSNLTDLSEAVLNAKKYALAYFDVCKTMEYDPTKPEDVSGNVLDLVKSKAELLQLKNYPTIDAPIVKTICELLNIDSITNAPDAINALRESGKDVSFVDKLPPFTVALLKRTVEVLSARYNRNITEIELMVDMFLRYTVERWNEWFYPFAISKAEILSIAKSINPEIKTYQDVETAIKGGL